MYLEIIPEPSFIAKSKKNIFTFLLMDTWRRYPPLYHQEYRPQFLKKKAKKQKKKQMQLYIP